MGAKEGTCQGGSWDGEKARDDERKTRLGVRSFVLFFSSPPTDGREVGNLKTHLRIILLQESQHPHVVPPGHSVSYRVGFERLRIRRGTDGSDDVLAEGWTVDLEKEHAAKNNNKYSGEGRKMDGSA